MFLHDYHLACEISTVRTLALNLLNSVHRTRTALTNSWVRCPFNDISYDKYCKIHDFFLSDKTKI